MTIKPSRKASSAASIVGLGLIGAGIWMVHRNGHFFSWFFLELAITGTIYHLYKALTGRAKRIAS
jgi:hypothetical protein